MPSARINPLPRFGDGEGFFVAMVRRFSETVSLTSETVIFAKGRLSMDSRPLFRKTSCLQLSALTLFAVLAGCGPSFSRVSGTVTYKGQKLTMGMITFFSDDGKKKHPTSIGSNGYYEAI